MRWQVAWSGTYHQGEPGMRVYVRGVVGGSVDGPRPPFILAPPHARASDLLYTMATVTEAEARMEARAQEALAIAAATNLGKRRAAPADDAPSSSVTAAAPVRSVGTAGPVGASYSVESVDWKCSKCKSENRGDKTKCVKCRSARPQGAGGTYTDPARRPDHGWREVLDPATQQMYYWHTVTGKTSWERPAVMGAAPTGTGWYGRGAAGTSVTERLASEDQQYRQRAAFQQAETMDERKAQRLEGANEFNVWYGKWVGEHWSAETKRTPAETRCVPLRDCGMTKGDKTTKGQTFYCLYFARGACAAGEKCQYIHRVPLPEDAARIDNMHDCFGRERHAAQRDDMNGVGTFSKDCRTLYVGGLKTTKYKDEREGKSALHEIVSRHFSKWGEVENVNVVWRISTAFVRYRLRISAEFAKEAMACQALEDGEVLMVRWAYDDSNVVAKKAVETANQDAMFAAMRAKEAGPLAAGPAPLTGPVGPPQAKKPRR